MTRYVLDRPHGVYRFYSATDHLLYVGCTSDLARRVRAHKNKQPWWSEVARVEADEPRSAFAALAAERRAIGTEAPLYNVVGNPDALRVEVRHPDRIVAVPARSTA